MKGGTSCQKHVYPSSGFTSIENVKANQQKQQQQISVASEQLLSKRCVIFFFAVITFWLIWEAFTRAKTVSTRFTDTKGTTER